MRTVVTMICALPILTSALGCHAPEPRVAPTKEQVAAAEEFLFVQNATSGQYDGEHLKLNKVAPTIFFADRPYRVFGHVDPEAFIEAWTRGPNSFATDPPNAVLSLLGEGQTQSFTVKLMDPKLTDGDLTYRVKVESGTIPASFKSSSLFIDNEAWAAVGGFAAGHFFARRNQEREAAAYAKGAASVPSVAVEAPSYYYQAAPPSNPVPLAPPPPPPPPMQKPPAQAVPALLQQAISDMQAFARTASPQDQSYVQQLIHTLQGISADFSSVAK
jgi:hypothetical protein